MLYASLVGPLLDVYYPLPFTDETANRAALNTSKLHKLWCSIYTETQVDQMISEAGGIKLPSGYRNHLDYDSSAIHYKAEKA